MKRETTAPDLPRRERKKLETRQRLYEAAVALFEERGYDGTRVEDITARADVAVGTFFNYFPSKDAVVQEGQRRSLEGTVAHARAIDAVGTEERFRQQFRWLARQATSGRLQMARVFIRRLMAEPAITQPNRPLVEELFRVYDTWIETGKATGAITPNIDTRTATLTLHELWSHNVLRWAGNPEEIALEKRIMARLDIVFGGLRMSRKQRG